MICISIYILNLTIYDLCKKSGEGGGRVAWLT